MASAGRVQTMLTCAKAQERRTMLPDEFSVGYFQLGTRLQELGYEFKVVVSQNMCITVARGHHSLTS